VWSRRSFTGGVEVEVEAPIGQPPVFFRNGSSYAGLFHGLAQL
jgi:alpha-glucosidase